MKQLLRTFTMLAAIAAVIAMPSCRHGSQTGLRLMSYNVRNCRGLDDTLSYERVARIITDAGADIVALQELDSMTSRYPGQDVLGNLAELTGMYPTYAPSIDFAGGKYGIGMLSREKPLSHRRVPLPCRSEPRSLLIVEFTDCYYCCTHLSLNAEDRVTDVCIIIDELSKLDKPAFLAGDFNASPDEEAMRMLSQYFTVFAKQPAATYPADKPTEEIDYICQYTATQPHAAAEVENHHVIGTSESADVATASDHRPIVADVRFEKWIASMAE